MGRPPCSAWACSPTGPALGAFAAGVVLLAAVLFIPGLTNLFQVAPLTLPLLGIIVGLAFAPTLVIQIWKVICDLRKGR